MTTTAGAGGFQQEKPHAWTYDEAESIVAALLANGFSARSYKRKPTGYEVRVSGTRGGQRFAYTIKTWDEYLDLEGLITRGLTGADKLYTEGE